jgi:hypothetical protein
MAGMNTSNSDHLIRSEVWSTQLKDVLLDNLESQRLVDWIDFPDGNTLTIPSIGELSAEDYAEDTAVKYRALDTGEWQMNITEYVQSGTYITEKNKQDGFYMSQLEGSFVPKMARAIQERLERDIFKEGQPKTGNPAGYQVAGNANRINGADHRFVGSDTKNSKTVLGLKDFSLARYALKKANLPDTNLIAIVDPHVEELINEAQPLASMSYNPRWEGIIETGIASGMSFIRNIFGFDVYTSNRLPLCGANQGGTTETINSVASGANSTCNLFFAAVPDLLPVKGAWRQHPKVDSEFNKDFQREEYVTTARYGTKIYRPENLVTVLSNNPY